MKRSISEAAARTGYANETFVGVDESTGDLNVTIWTKIPKIEIWTSRGRSYCVQGENALKLARYFRDAIVVPMLGKEGK